VLRNLLDKRLVPEPEDLLVVRRLRRDSKSNGLGSHVWPGLCHYEPVDVSD
jgi:hypothetical protein